MRDQRLRVTGGTFERLPAPFGPGWVMRVACTGDGFAHRGLSLRARVGAHEMRAVMVSPFEGGFSGFLERVPNEGDRVYVGYSGEGELATDVVYHAAGRDPGRERGQTGMV